MLNKAVYTVNIMLILFWSYSLIDLWRQMTVNDGKSIAEHGIQWVALQKTDRPWEPDARNLFDSKPIPPKPVNVPQSPPEDALNEKSLADMTLRVRGIFTSRHQRFAVIEKDLKKPPKKEIVRVVAGDAVVDYTVKQVQPDVVTLVNPKTGDAIVMKIFKPIQNHPGGVSGK